MTDIASDHLFLRQRLLPVLLRTVVVMVMHHCATVVVPEFRRRHRVPAEVFDASPGAPGFLREVDLPAAPVLHLKVTLPLFFTADMPQPRQAKSPTVLSCCRAHSTMLKLCVLKDA